MTPVIVMPSFVGHLEAVRSFLESFNRLVEDKKSVEIKLILSAADMEPFRAAIAPYTDLRLQLVSYREMMAEYGIGIGEESALLERLGKFNFQTIKKLFAALRYGSDTCLLMDSEAVVIRPCRIADLFHTYLHRKYLFYSPFIGTELQQQVQTNVCELFGDRYEDVWLFDHQNWFVEGCILRELVAHFGGPEKFYEKLCSRAPIFELVLYYWWIRRNGEKYGYEMVNSADELRRRMGPRIYRDFYQKIRDVGLTLMEFCGIGMTASNVAIFKNMFDQRGINLFRPIEHAEFRESNRAFIHRTNSVKILACCPNAVEFASAVNDP